MLMEASFSGGEDGVTRAKGEISGDPALSDAYCHFPLARLVYGPVWSRDCIAYPIVTHVTLFRLLTRSHDLSRKQAQRHVTRSSAYRLSPCDRVLEFRAQSERWPMRLSKAQHNDSTTEEKA